MSLALNIGNGPSPLSHQRRVAGGIAEGVSCICRLSRPRISPGACLATTDRTAWKNATSSRILSASSCGTDSANAWESSVTTLMKNIFIWHRAVIILEFVGLESAPDWKITRVRRISPGSSSRKNSPLKANPCLMSTKSPSNFSRHSFALPQLLQIAGDCDIQICCLGPLVDAFMPKYCLCLHSGFVPSFRMAR